MLCLTDNSEKNLQPIGRDSKKGYPRQSVRLLPRTRPARQAQGLPEGRPGRAESGELEEIPELTEEDKYYLRSEISRMDIP